MSWNFSVWTRTVLPSPVETCATSGIGQLFVPGVLVLPSHIRPHRLRPTLAPLFGKAGVTLLSDVVESIAEQLHTKQDPINKLYTNGRVSQN